MTTENGGVTPRTRGTGQIQQGWTGTPGQSRAAIFFGRCDYAKHSWSKHQCKVSTVKQIKSHRGHSLNCELLFSVTTNYLELLKASIVSLKFNPDIPARWNRMCPKFNIRLAPRISYRKHEFLTTGNFRRHDIWWLKPMLAVRWAGKCFLQSIRSTVTALHPNEPKNAAISYTALIFLRYFTVAPGMTPVDHISQWFYTNTSISHVPFFQRSFRIEIRI